MVRPVRIVRGILRRNWRPVMKEVGARVEDSLGTAEKANMAPCED